MNQETIHSRTRAAALSLVILLSLLVSGCLRRTLVTGLSELEAREVAVALYKGDLRSYVVREPKTRAQDEAKWQVDIEGGDRTQVEAWRVLQENGLPRHHDSGVEEVYKNSQLIPTASEERARFLLALSGELTRSLKTIPGVVDSRVHVVIPDATILRGPNDKPHPTASVLLKYWAGSKAPPEDQVRKLVANGVEGLDEKNISVMIAELPSPNHDPGQDLRHTLAPTVGMVVDYAYWGMTILGMWFGIWFLFRVAPGVIRWTRSHAALLKESLVG